MSKDVTVVRNIEIIGEAAKNLSDASRALHFEIPWKRLAGIRDKLIHDYFGVTPAVTRAVDSGMD